MSKSNIDAEVNNQIFRKDFPMVIASRRELATIAPGRLFQDGNDYLPGQCLVRVTSTGQFKRWSAASGGSFDSPCILFEPVLAYQQDSTVTGGALARLISSAEGGVYKSQLVDYNSGFKTALAGKEFTDATGVTVVKF